MNQIKERRPLLSRKPGKSSLLTKSIILRLVGLAILSTFVFVSIRSNLDFFKTDVDRSYQLDYKSSYITDTFCIDKSLPVLKGADVVAYFDLKKGFVGYVKGLSDLTSIYHGFTFMFSSIQNKQKFDLNPEKYIPSFGSFCAYGMAFEENYWSLPYIGLGPPVDPAYWLIGQDGRLYVFKDSVPRGEFMLIQDEAIPLAEIFW
eukprot:CAMPEP_0171461072 /NCGR_PEP_ID=MMETSP0945-20130129/5673_1 /TAXON_ID=109269 /ORGANISM="Vaucheria litorea, Strain CCMP2940" /LENGTH=202 /DNA_ID=CAMNT_0011987359 /DNA_START=54 /DNA_END=659 /DNA_ORIENTATION=-